MGRGSRAAAVGRARIWGRPKKRLVRLYRILSGDRAVDPPAEWIISRICESFNCTPSVAFDEYENDPHLLLTILQLRAFADAKEAIDRDREKVQMSPMVQRVMMIEAKVAGISQMADHFSGW